MSESTSIIIAPALPVANVEISALAITAKDEALTSSALIGKVSNRAENEACVAAKKKIKGIMLDVERQRKALKEPVLEYGRAIDRTAEAFKLELDQELGRLTQLETEFLREEQRRVAEERRKQQEELERIERERQAELRRIEEARLAEERKAREAAEAKAREEREAAEALAREAKTKAQREAAERARIEAEQRAEAARIEAEAKAEQARKQAEIEAQKVQERADQLAYVESRPVEITRAAGQIVREEWVIDSINEFQLMKARPDLVRKVDFDMVGLKQSLAAGNTVPGVKAHKEIKTGTRQAGGKIIEV